MAPATTQFIGFSVLLFIPTVIGILLLLIGAVLCFRDNGEQYAIGMGIGLGIGICGAFGTWAYYPMYLMQKDRKEPDTQTNQTSQTGQTGQTGQATA